MSKKIAKTQVFKDFKQWFKDVFLFYWESFPLPLVGVFFITQKVNRWHCFAQPPSYRRGCCQPGVHSYFA